MTNADKRASRAERLSENKKLPAGFNFDQHVKVKKELIYLVMEG